MHWKQFSFIIVFLAAAALCITGCGGGSSSSSATVSVAVTSSAATVDGTDTTTLSATVTNDKNAAGVTWATSAGTLSNSSTSGVTLTAPAATSSAQTITVTATSIADTSKNGTATITVPAAPAITALTTAQQTVSVGTAYSVTLSGTGGITPYKNWALASGSGVLPPCLSLSTAGVLSSSSIPTATCVGSYTGIKFTMSDSGTPNALTATSSAQTITVTAAPAITFGAAPTATSTFNVAYSSSVTASGGVGTLTYSRASGSLPPHFALASTGAITGTPQASDIGTWSFAVAASDAYGDSANSANYTIVVSYPQLSVTTGATLPTGYGAIAYSKAFAATGGNGGPYTWTVTSGSASLAALNLSLSSSGVLSGTPPLAGGSASFTAHVADSAGNTATGTFSLTINAGLQITSASPLPAGYGKAAYSQTLTTSGGSNSGLTWTVTSNASSLAALNLSLSSGGVLSGTPPLAGGSASFGVSVTDSASNTATATLALTINPGIAVTAPALSAAYPGAAYTSSAFTAAGGNGGPYTWSIAAASGSSVPAGFAINSSSGIISATSPSNSGTSTATYNVVITASDSLGNTGSANATITIQASVRVATATTLSPGTVGVAYSQTLTATGGSGAGYTWQDTGAGDAAALAAIGLSFNATTGVLSGASPTLGSASFTVTVTDNQSHVSAPVTLSIAVTNQLKINQTSLPPGNVGSSYSQTLTGSGGSGTGYIFTETTSNLASYGLTLAQGGAITGTPSASGTVSFTARVTDSNSGTATQNLSIQVYSALSLSANGTLPNGYTGVDYSGSVTGSGGSGSLAISVSSALAPANGTLSTAVSGTSVNVTGKPANATSESVGVTLTDNTTSNTLARTYNFTVSTPPAPTLPASSLQNATVNQIYSQTITATDNVGTAFTWKINGSAVPTDGSQVSVGNGLTVSNTGASTLSISGTPTSTTQVSFTASITDTTTGLTSSTVSYTITVNSAGYTVSGTVNITSHCANETAALPVPYISLHIANAGNTFTQDASLGSGGSSNFSFSSVPNGTYTITPSFSGLSGATAAFYPSTASVTVNNGAVSSVSFNVVVGYTVTGTVSYSGTHTGQIYVNLLDSNCGGSQGQYGTSISSAGSYTIHGVQPGTYSVIAYMDPTDLGLGYGFMNSSDPYGTASSMSISGSASNISVTMSNNNPSSAPSTPKINLISSTHTGVLVVYKPVTTTVNSITMESATSYDVAWSTSSTVSSGSLNYGSNIYRFKALSTSDPVLILNNNVVGSTAFSDGTTYYFQMRANNSAGNGSWVVYSSGVTVNPPSGSNTISGNITIPSGTTVGSRAQLYVGVYSNSLGVYGTVVSSPAVGSNNPYSVNVPSGTWQIFAILDQNNDGQIDVTDLTNTHDNMPSVTINGSTTQNITLPSANMQARAITTYSKQVSSGGTYSGYTMTLGGGQGVKLPVSVQLTNASNPNVPVPMDISNFCTDCGSIRFGGWQSLANSTTPAVGDTYTYAVTYNDGTSENVTATVTGWNGGSTIAGASQLPTSLLPNGTTGPSAGTRTQPTFTWTPASSATGSTNLYNFWICCSSSSNIWNVPSESDGFLSSVTSITWGMDPSDSSNTPSVTSLTAGTTYSWSIEVEDANQNQVQSTTYYIP